MEKKYLTVTALNRYLKFKIDADNQLQHIYIKGELSNFKHHRSNHLYFTLKDEHARVNAVMFASNAKKLLFQPADGMKVLIKASVSIYEATGVYQLYVETMEQDGLGNLFLRYEKLKKELAAKGLFDVAKKKEIPRFPTKIAVLSANPSAALADVVKTIKMRFPIVRIVVFPIPVQGKDAYIQICQTLKFVDSLNFNTIIIARGGGSIEELWNFNEEQLAYTIYECKTPIISGVGHEVDFTICDFVSDFRAITPTAAAIKATPDIMELHQLVDNNRYTLNNLMKQKIALAYENINRLSSFYLFKNPNKLYEDKKLLLDSLDERLYHNFQLSYQTSKNKTNQLIIKFNSQTSLFLNQQKNQLKQINFQLNQEIKHKLQLNQEKYLFLIEKLNALSPLETIKRGYSIVSKNQKIVSSVKDLNSGDEISLKLHDGDKKAIIK